MKLEKYISMDSVRLDAEIAKEKERIRKAKTTISLLEKLKIANKDSENSSCGNSKNPDYNNHK